MTDSSGFFMDSAAPFQHFPAPELTDDDFSFISHLVRTRFGINLTEQKRSLVIGRLQKLLREKGHPDFHAYRLHLEAGAGDAELDDLVNRISTNHTFFFREPEHFAFMRDTALPEMAARHQRDKDLRVWCAAASSGEEPYSIMITMQEYFGMGYREWNGGLLATDISAKALAAARAGIYPEERLGSLSEGLRRKYFNRNATGAWQVSDNLRKEITFRRFNLMNESFPFRKPFDMILCRNVMIYFDQPTRDRLVERFARFILPGGYLLIGHSESIGRSHPEFEYVKPAVYRRAQ